MDELCIKYKNSLYNGLSKIGKCLSSDKRIEILDLLAQGEKTVEKISLETGMTVANTSRHLQILKDGNLVSCEKKKNFVVYKISNEKIIDLVYLLINVGETQLSDVQKIHDEFYEKCCKAKILTVKEAQEMVKKENVLIIDLRPEDEFNSNHIENAINIPMKMLEGRLEDLPKDKKIIVYCRGRNCAYANIASRILTNHGFCAYSLNQSYYEWNKYKI